MLIASSITQTHIQRRLQALKGSGATVALLIDRFALENVNLSEVEVDLVCVVPEIGIVEFSRLADAGHIFLYAVDQDDLGLPYVAVLASKGVRFFPVGQSRPGPYAKMNLQARASLEEEAKRQTAERFAKFDHGPGDFMNLMQAVEITNGLSGKYVEVGCFNGSSGCAVLNYLRRTHAEIDCYFLDVFEGFNYPEALESPDSFWKGSHVSHGFDVVSARLKSHEDQRLGLNVHVRKNNIISDPFPGEIDRIRVANLDVDMFEAVLAGLTKLAPRIVPGGILVVEDPGHTPKLIGARLALEEFRLTEQAATFLPPIFMESGQFFLIKRDRQEGLASEDPVARSRWSKPMVRDFSE